VQKVHQTELTKGYYLDSDGKDLSKLPDRIFDTTIYLFSRPFHYLGVWTQAAYRNAKLAETWWNELKS
jgi:hypothetical protein